jgi:flagellar hook-associated protein 3 FlgL
MKTTFISTLSLWNSPRNAVSKLQGELAKANQEIVTGRYADVGLELGHKTGQGIALRQDSAELDAFTNANALTSRRLSITKTSLDQIRETAETFLSELISLPPHETGARMVRDNATVNLKNLVLQLNMAEGGQYIFAGTNTTEKPLKAYIDEPTSDAKTAVDDAFMARFGISQTDPGVAAIAAADMEEFLNDEFAELFETGWEGVWSTAQNDNIESRISPNEKIKTSTNANELAMKKLAMAYTMISDLGLPDMHVETREVIIGKAMEIMGSITHDIVKIQASIGTAEKLITEANARMELQKNIFEEGLGKLEGVDPAEAKTRVDGYTTQIQMSYSLTSQLRQLNLINYL